MAKPSSASQLICCWQFAIRTLISKHKAENYHTEAVAITYCVTLIVPSSWKDLEFKEMFKLI